MKNNLTKGYRHRLYIVFITLDIENAFNTVNWTLLVEELQRRKISDYLIRLICSCFSDRKIVTKSGVEYDMYMRVSRGSILGTLLWNIYYERDIRETLPDGVNILCYADDTALLVSARTFGELKKRIRSAITKIKNAIVERKLELAEEKTEMVVLYGGKKK